MKRKPLGLIALLFACALLAYCALGLGLYYWKEYVHHYRAGAYSDLLALHTIQENYKSDHGQYAGAFSELGVPMGAHLEGETLEWDDGPYRFRFVRTVHDPNGALTGYEIEARAVYGSSWRWSALRIDETGKIHR